MTWWNQLPVDGTASHPTITSRALPMMWPIIHQCTIWKSLMNQLWMNIIEWPRFHPLVVYRINPPLPPSYYARMVDAQLNTLVSYDLWIPGKSASYSHVIHPTWCAGGCWFTLVEISYGSSSLRGHLHQKKYWPLGHPRPQVTPSSDLKWDLGFCDFEWISKVW
jgi:hypothetical protein